MALSLRRMRKQPRALSLSTSSASLQWSGRKAIKQNCRQIRFKNIPAASWSCSTQVAAIRSVYRTKSLTVTSEEEQANKQRRFTNLNETRNICNNVFWTDETKTEMCGQHHVWRKPNISSPTPSNTVVEESWFGFLLHPLGLICSVY